MKKLECCINVFVKHFVTLLFCGSSEGFWFLILKGKNSFADYFFLMGSIDIKHITSGSLLMSPNGINSVFICF